MELQAMTKELVEQQMAVIDRDLDMLSNENAVLDSERNPEFRARVAAELDTANAEVERLTRIVDAREDVEMS